MPLLPTPELKYAFTLEVDLAQPMTVGKSHAGTRRIIPIKGGRVHGPNVNGRIIDTGADWQTVHENGVAFLDARYAFETDDGAIVEIQNTGFRHGPPEVLKKLAAGEPCPPESYYMRSTAYLTTGHPAYHWMNKTVFVATGARFEKTVQIDLYAIE